MLVSAKTLLTKKGNTSQQFIDASWYRTGEIILNSELAYN